MTNQGFIDQVTAVDNSTVQIYAFKHRMELDNKAVEELADNVIGPAFEFRTRYFCVKCTKSLDNLPESVVVHALDAAVHFNSRLARQGQSLLEKELE